MLTGPCVGLVIAALTVYLGFNAGGFFPTATAIAALVVCALCVITVMLVERPFERFNGWLLAATAGFAGYAVWSLISVAWSGSPGRGLLEFDRALLYVLTLVFFGMLGGERRRLAWGLRGFLLAAFVIATVGWITRVAADVWPIAIDVQPQRLSFPLTYWNALGLLSGLAIIGFLHLAADPEGPRWSRPAALATLPILASTLLLTFSRASLALAVFGVIVYLVVARPRLALTAVAAAAIPTAIAVIASYRAEIVGSGHFAGAAGIHQGHQLALVVLGCAVVAAVLRIVMFRFDARIAAWPALRVTRQAKLGAMAAVLAVAAVALLALGGPSWISSRYHDAVDTDAVGHLREPRARLTSVGNNGRIPQWEAAIEAFDEEPLRGTGAGTYQLTWAQKRPYAFAVVNAHSLYIQAMGELGIVGLLLVLGGVLTVLIGFAWRARGPNRALYGAVFAMALIWAIHAGVDWDWEMPAITLWLFALAGLGLGAAIDRSRAIAGPRRITRIVAAIAIGVLAVTPVAVAISQTKLDDAISAFDRDDCRAAISDALGSLSALKVRPEPYEVLGYCDARLGQYQLAETAMSNAIKRDPDNWETHYGLALVTAAAGHDPLPQLRQARRLNPLEPTILEAIDAMRGADPQQRRRRAEVARLPL